MVAFTFAAAGEPDPASRERSSALIDDASAKAQERAREIRSSMDKVIIPEVTLSGVPFGEAIARISAQVTEHASPSLPGRRGMTIALQLRSEAPDPVTVSLRSAALPKVLDTICAEHNYVWCVESYAIRIVPEGGATTRKSVTQPASPAQAAK